MHIDDFINLKITDINKVNFTEQAMNKGQLICSVTMGKEVSLISLEGQEEISKCYSFIAYLYSSDFNIDPEECIGTNITFKINTSATPRYINGLITKFSRCFIGEINGVNYACYVMEVRPKLWLLSLNKNCRVFQNKSALDIIKQILQENDIQDVDYKIMQCGQSVREYCVQYNESDFDFISRLMEAEGIFYFFIHNEDKHTLVLADSANGYYQNNGCSNVVYNNYFNKYIINYVLNVKNTASIVTDAVAATDYNFEVSKTDLYNEASNGVSKLERFEYPGNFKKKNDGLDIVNIRLRELGIDKHIISGESSISNFSPGSKTNIENYSADDLLITKVYHKLDVFAPENQFYKNRFWAVPANIEYHPKRNTPIPKIFGSQTAMIVGPDGEEIYRDKFGRVKVHFYWDRYGEQNENSSCWIRVAQIWAGNSWGALYTPRIGQEVVVSFECGNPDRPIIVGCVYNDQYMPPYSEQEATKSTVKSASSKGEEGFNEIRFEDLKDEEEIYIHAQKDMNIDIINQRTTLLEEGSDFLTISKGSRSVLISAEGEDPGNLSTTLNNGDIITEIAEGNSITTLTKGNMSITLSEGDMSVSLNKGNYAEALSNGNKTLEIKGDYTIKISGKLSVEVDGGINIKSKQSISIEGKDMTQKTQTDLTMEAGTNLSQKGRVNLFSEAGVSYSVKGVNTLIQGTASISANGASVSVQGSGACSISSPSVAIGGGVIMLG